MFTKRENEIMNWVATQRTVNVIDNHGLLTLERIGSVYSLHYGMKYIESSVDGLDLYNKFELIKQHCYCNSLPGTPCDYCTGLRSIEN